MFFIFLALQSNFLSSNILSLFLAKTSHWPRIGLSCESTILPQWPRRFINHATLVLCMMTSHLKRCLHRFCITKSLLHTSSYICAAILALCFPWLNNLSCISITTLCATSRSPQRATHFWSKQKTRTKLVQWVHRRTVLGLYCLNVPIRID